MQCYCCNPHLIFSTLQNAIFLAHYVCNISMWRCLKQQISVWMLFILNIILLFNVILSSFHNFWNISIFTRLVKHCKIFSRGYFTNPSQHDSFIVVSYKYAKPALTFKTLQVITNLIHNEEHTIWPNDTTKLAINPIVVEAFLSNHKCKPHDGIKGNVRGSQKSLGYIVWGTCTKISWLSI